MSLANDQRRSLLARAAAAGLAGDLSSHLPALFYY